MPLFYGQEGKTLSYQGLEKMIKKMGIVLGEKTGTHTMRKTGARIIFDKTKDSVFATQLLGHSNIQSMLSYVGLTSEEFQKKSKEIGLI
jgi:site-specific recombinase XerD